VDVGSQDVRGVQLRNPTRETELMRVRNRHPAPHFWRARPIAWFAAIAAPVIVAGSLIAVSLASGSQAAAESTTRIAMTSNTSAASSPTTPIWSTQLDFDNNGTAWSESFFAGLRADGLTTAELDMPWGTIEPSPGTFSFSEFDTELANASAAGIQLIPIFWQAGWGGSPAPWITDFEVGSGGAQGLAPAWWDPTEQSEYLTYVTDTIKNAVAQAGGYGGAVLDYGYLDAMWDLNGAGGGWAADDLTEFRNTYLPDAFGTIATFNSDNGTSYSSFSQVPAAAPGQALFGVFQAFRAWSVAQTYGQLTADARAVTASTPLYYYFGGGFGNATSYANNPDTFFKLAKQYNVTIIDDDASSQGLTLTFGSLARAYGVKLAQEWTAPPSNTQLAAEAAQWISLYSVGLPEGGGEDFFIHDGTEKDIVGFPIYTSWLPTLKSLSGSYPQQPAAVYIDFSQGYGNTNGGSLGSVEGQLADLWLGDQAGFTVVTSQEVNNGAISLSQFKAILPLNGTDANLTAYKNAGGTLLTAASQLSQYAPAYASLASSGVAQVVPAVSSSGTSAQLTLADITSGTAYDNSITINPAGLGLASGTYHVVNASGAAVPQEAVAGGICTDADLPAASLTEWSVVAGAAPSGTAAPSNCGASTSPACGTLTANQELTANQSLTSCNGDYTLTMQGDGNLVLYQGSTALWASNTAGTAADEAIMQGDGNFVVYTSAGSPLWSSGTAGNPGADLVVQNDGNLVVYSASGAALWASGTNGK
jgi:hypothetical protein